MFNPNQMMGMMGKMMGGQGGNPMAMMSQMFGNNPQMMEMAQQIMSGKVSQEQFQNMLNQQMGGKAPNLQGILEAINRIQQNGEVIVTDDKNLYSKFASMNPAIANVLRYSPKVKGVDIMTKQEFEQNHMN